MTLQVRQPSVYSNLRSDCNRLDSRGQLATSARPCCFWTSSLPASTSTRPLSVRRSSGTTEREGKERIEKGASTAQPSPHGSSSGVLAAASPSPHRALCSHGRSRSARHRCGLRDEIWTYIAYRPESMFWKLPRIRCSISWLGLLLPSPLSLLELLSPWLLSCPRLLSGAGVPVAVRATFG